MHIAIVVSRFNQFITQRLWEGTVARLTEKGVSMDQIATFWVPGAVEIPLIAQRLADTEQYDAIIALGAVIRGETSHYHCVCEQVSQGCQRVALDNDIPVIFGVLTTEDESQALARCGGEQGHKGQDAADAVLEMIKLLQTIDETAR